MQGEESIIDRYDEMFSGECQPKINVCTCAAVLHLSLGIIYSLYLFISINIYNTYPCLCIEKH